MIAISKHEPHPSKNLLITSEKEHISLITQAVSLQSSLISDVAHLVAQYAHDKSLTNWHTALSRLDKLPEQIPPLLLNDQEIRDGICSIPGSFYLIPRGTLNEFEKMVSAYGQKNLAEFRGENPLRFRFFLTVARPFDKTQSKEDEWRWMSDDILEGSRDESYEKQAEMVAKFGANFEIPSLRDAAVCLLLHKVATGESLLKKKNAKNKGLSTNTHVQEEITHGSHLAVGGSDPSGVCVNFVYTAHQKVGVVALRKFPST